MHLQPPSMHEIKYLEWVLLFSPPHPKPKWFRNRLKFYFVHSFIDLHLLNPITPIKFLKGHKCLGSLCVPKSQGSPFELSAYSVWTARNMWLMILNIFIGHNNKYSLISKINQFCAFQMTCRLLGAKWNCNFFKALFQRAF